MYDTDSLLRDAVKKSEENIHKVGRDLLDRLKVVYVDSKDNNPDQPRFVQIKCQITDTFRS